MPQEVIKISVCSKKILVGKKRPRDPQVCIMWKGVMEQNVERKLSESLGKCGLRRDIEHIR